MATIYQFRSALKKHASNTRSFVEAIRANEEGARRELFEIYASCVAFSPVESQDLPQEQKDRHYFQTSRERLVNLIAIEHHFQQAQLLISQGIESHHIRIDEVLQKVPDRHPAKAPLRNSADKQYDAYTAEHVARSDSYEYRKAKLERKLERLQEAGQMLGLK